MGSKLDVVMALIDETYKNLPSSFMSANEKYLSEDFKNLDIDGSAVLDKKTYIGMSMLIFNAFKDMKAVISDKREDADGVILKFHFEGTQTGDLDLSAMGMGIIPASGKKIVWAEQSARWKVNDGKIMSIQAITGSLEDFFAPLGVKPPKTLPTV